MLYNNLKELFFEAKNKEKGQPIANNTYVVKTNRGYGVLYHQTVIIDVSKNNKAILDNGGWFSVTTKQRLNEYLPAGYNLTQKKGAWFIETPNNKKQEYRNGMKIDLILKGE